MRKLILTLLLLFLIGCANELPECYITEGECSEGYDKINWENNYWDKVFIDSYGEFSLDLVQCCREPHYLLQSIEPTLYEMKTLCNEIENTPYYEGAE